jgi:acyl-CoA thioesterase I
MRKHLLLILLAATIFCAAGSEAKRILVLGDSIAAGYGIDPEEAYPALLQEKIDRAGLNYTVVNAGVSGDTTAGGLRRITWLLRQPVAILVLELGGNDGLRGISPEETEKNLEGIIDKVREKYPSAQIVLAGMQMPENMGADYAARFRAVFARVAKEKKAALIPFLLEGVGGKAELNQADRIHPTAKGHQLVAENVWKTLRPLLEAAEKRS